MNRYLEIRILDKVFFFFLEEENISLNELKYESNNNYLEQFEINIIQ